MGKANKNGRAVNLLMNGYTTHSTINNKNQNDGVVVYLKDSLKDVFNRNKKK